jgi:streptogramin lyase
MQYTGAFKQYAYPVYAGAVAGLPGLNTLAVDSSGTVWTLLLVSANAPTTGAVAQLSPQNGSIGEFLTSPPGDYFTSIASAGAQAVWAVDLTPAIRNGGNAATGVDVFVNTSSIQNGFDPEAMPVFAEGLGADGRMYVATDPSELTNVPPPSEVFRYNPMTLALIDTVALPSGSRATQFAAGPDGAIWFTDSGLNKIGRIASSGAVTYFSVLTPNSGLAGIAPGSDNAMWFTETNAGKIGRIGLSGGVNEYAIPTPNEQPMGISAGTAGGCLPQTLYFTEANGLGKLTFKT